MLLLLLPPPTLLMMLLPRIIILLLLVMMIYQQVPLPLTLTPSPLGSNYNLPNLLPRLHHRHRHHHLIAVRNHHNTFNKHRRAHITRALPLQDNASIRFRLPHTRIHIIRCKNVRAAHPKKTLMNILTMNMSLIILLGKVRSLVGRRWREKIWERIMR